jgi:hypothetical protein
MTTVSVPPNPRCCNAVLSTSSIRHILRVLRAALQDAVDEELLGWKIQSPAAKRRAVDMLKETLSMSERLGCKAVGLARSTYRRLPLAAAPADPDADLRAASWRIRHSFAIPVRSSPSKMRTDS